MATAKLRYYTGVGSRKTPKNILALMTQIALKLSEMNYILRSGGAKGADLAFEIGVNNGNKQIFFAKDANEEAKKIAASFHPNWEACSSYAKQLHARNAFQVLGKNLKSPSDFLICWTPDGCTSQATRTIKTGGTGTAISIAEAYNIPVFNLYYELTVKRIKTGLNI